MITTLLTAILMTSQPAPDWKPPKYWQGAPIRSCQRWPDGTRCCGYRDGDRAYVVCNGEVVAASQGARR
jgi:hypothetical protein